MSEEQRPQYIEDDEIDLLELFGVLWRYKRVVIGVTGLAAVGVLVFAIISLTLPPDRSPLPNQYKPSALILINDDSGGGLASALSSSGLDSLAGLAGVSSGGGYGELAVKLATSKTVLDIIADEFDVVERYDISESVRGNARKAINSHLSVEHDPDTSTVTISYEDIDPEYARDVVNRIVELLDRRFVSIGGSQNITKKNMLEQKLAEVEAEMARLEGEIQAFQTKHGILDVESLAAEQVGVMARLRSQLILKDMEVKTYSDFARIDDPVIKRLRAERHNLAELINEMETGFDSYEAVLPSQQDLPKLALEFSHLKRDLLIQSKIYEILTQQYELAKLNVEGEEPVFQVLEVAEAPDLKSGPSRSIIVIVTTFSAFFFSVILAFVLNAARNIRNDPERMKKLRGEG